MSSSQLVSFLIVLPKVFLPLVVAQSIRCYKFKASATKGAYDTEKFNPKKFLIQANLQQCVKGVTHCIMVKGIIKNVICVIKNIMRHLFSGWDDPI